MSTSSATTDGPWTVRRVLEWTTGYLKDHGSESPRLDAEVLLAHARGCPRIQLYTSYDEVLPETVRAQMREMVTRRAAAEPVAYLVGHREFFGLDFEVTPDVLIPRPDTETLVIEAVEALKPLTTPRLLDLGTGSGCIAVALATHNASVVVTAVDTSCAALDVARRNAARHELADRIRFVESDLFDSLDVAEPFDVVLSNPPYVRTDEVEQLAPEVRLHEPQAALVGGADGLDFFRRIIDGSPAFLKPGGLLLLECSPEQAPAIEALLSAARNFEAVRTIADLSGRPRVVSASCCNRD